MFETDDMVHLIAGLVHIPRLAQSRAKPDMPTACEWNDPKREQLFAVEELKRAWSKQLNM